MNFNTNYHEFLSNCHEFIRGHSSCIRGNSCVKGQSLIEYVITLTAIIGAIVTGSLAFRDGVTRSVDTYQRSVDATVTNDNPWAPHDYFIKNPKCVSGGNPAASYENYLNYQDEDAGGKPSNPNI